MTVLTGAGTPEADIGVRVTRSQAGVATVEWRTSAPRNAWNNDIDEAYAREIQSLDSDPSVRVIVIRGAGPDFCAGREMTGLRAAADDTNRRSQSHGIDRTGSLRTPVVAVVTGACAGIGLTLALLADIRFAARTSVFSTSFARRGLPAGHATAWLLQRAVGHASATELLLSARTFGAAEAERLGLVSCALEDDRLEGHVSAYAEEMATRCAPRSLHLIKRQLAADRTSTYEEALTTSKALADEAFGTADFREGVASFQERRPPRFLPLHAVERCEAAPPGHDGRATCS